MEALWRDLSYAVRVMFKNRAFSVVAVLSLAIGIGASSTVFSVVNALLLRPLPYKDAEHLAILWQRSPGLNVAQDWFSPGQCIDIKTQNSVFEDTAVVIGASFNLTGNHAPERVDGARVSSSFFPLLGAEASLGRVLSPEEDVKGKPQSVVVLSNGFWQRRFGSDPNVIDKTIILNGNSFTIVGVMKPDFSLNKEVLLTVNAIERADILLPLPMNETDQANRGNEDFNILARLKAGVTFAEAQAEMDVIAARMKERYPESYPPTGGLTISVVPLLEQVVGDIRFTLYVLFGSVALVLLIACANVANLLLARAATRQKEIAIRSAVGASRLRVIRQLLAESFLLAIAGGLAGIAIAEAAVALLRAFGPENIPRLDEVAVDGRVVAFTFLVTLLTGIIFGLAPAVRASRVDLNEVLKEGGRGSSFGSHNRIRRLLVVFEVALSLVLLIGAGLLVRSYRNVTNAYPGFDAKNVLSMRLALPPSKYPNADSVIAFYRQLSEKISALPGVESAGISYSLPMSAVAFAWEPILVEGYVSGTGNDSIISNTRIITPGYFSAMRIPLVAGRYFDERDIKGAEMTAIVNEAMAARFWPNESAIGKRLQRSSAGVWLTVVGVISDAKQYSAEKEPPIAVYYPFEQYGARSMYMLARTVSDPSQMTAAITGAIQSLDGELPVFDVATMEQRLYGSLARQRFSMTALGVFAAFALTLAVIGIYGVMTYWVSQRTHEIGIRMALGAQPANIAQLVIKQSLILVSAGIAAGLAGAYALTQFMSSLLFGIKAVDLATFVLLSFALAVIALLSSYIPARRAAKVDPIIALRRE